MERGRGRQGHHRGIWTSDEHRSFRERLLAPLGCGRADRVHGRWNRQRKLFRGSRCGRIQNPILLEAQLLLQFSPPQIRFVLSDIDM